MTPKFLSFRVPRSLSFRVSIISLGTLVAFLALTTANVLFLLSQLRRNAQEIEDSYREVFKKNLMGEQLDEAFVSRRAHEVADDVIKYLKQEYGSLESVPSARELEQDRGLRAVALQWVTEEDTEGVDIVDADEERIGYTVVYSKNFTMTTHTQERLIGKDVSGLKEQPELYLFWWDIFGGAVIQNREVGGYYLWPEADGEVSLKYMVCMPIQGTRLMVASTIYPEFKNQDGIVESARSVAKTLFEFERSARRRVTQTSIAVVFMMAASVSLLLIIISRERGFVEAEKQRIEKFWRLTRIDSWVRAFSHGIRNDLFVIAENARALLKRTRDLENGGRRDLIEGILIKIIRRVERIQTRVDQAVADKCIDEVKRPIDVVEELSGLVNKLKSGGHLGAIRVDLFGLQSARIEGIKRELVVAFENIVVNAAQAMKGKGVLSIDISKRRRGGVRCVCLKFCDTGGGFTNVDRALEPDWTTRADEGGTGTGLAIVDRVVIEHDGYLDLRNNTRDGWGAEVEVCFPLFRQRSGWSQFL